MQCAPWLGYQPATAFGLLKAVAHTETPACIPALPHRLCCVHSRVFMPVLGPYSRPMEQSGCAYPWVCDRA